MHSIHADSVCTPLFSPSHNSKHVYYYLSQYLPHHISPFSPNW